MTITYKNKALDSIKADATIVVLEKKANFKKVLPEGEYKLLEEVGFLNEDTDSFYLPHIRTLFVKVDGVDGEEIKTVAANSYKALKKYNLKSVKVEAIGDNNLLFASAFCEGVILGAYEFDWYKSKEKKESMLKTFTVTPKAPQKDSKEEKEINEALERVVVCSENVNFARDLVNTTPDDATPIQIATIAENSAKEFGFDTLAYDEKYLADNSMGSFLAVSRASAHPPRLVHMIYKPQGVKNPKKAVLVGKGLTYDSGGLSLKPADYMVTMKADKAGACAVIAAMRVAAKLKLPVEVHGVIGLCENMIGGNAYKPDDVLKAKNGKTIEIRNTDAEGRLVLADVLCYIQDYFKAKNEKFEAMIDMATLTGACVVAVGEYTSGVMGHNEKLKSSILSASQKAGDLMAALPFNKHLRKLIKSEIADVANCSSSRYGGAITAAMFLDEFVYEENKQKWVHLDIAGPAYVEKSWGYNPHGASGTPVRTIVKWLEELK